MEMKAPISALRKHICPTKTGRGFVFTGSYPSMTVNNQRIHEKQNHVDDRGKEGEGGEVHKGRIKPVNKH